MFFVTSSKKNFCRRRDHSGGGRLRENATKRGQKSNLGVNEGGKRSPKKEGTWVFPQKCSVVFWGGIYVSFDQPRLTLRCSCDCQCVHTGREGLITSFLFHVLSVYFNHRYHLLIGNYFRKICLSGSRSKTKSISFFRSNDVMIL